MPSSLTYSILAVEAAAKATGKYNELRLKILSHAGQGSLRGVESRAAGREVLPWIP